VVFEDIPAGIASGRAAGMETVAVYDDFSRDLTSEKISLADHYISDYGELMK
jgi:beta-phosphoglucomutase-like phosphatase (HAD superfamily)